MTKQNIKLDKNLTTVELSLEEAQQEIDSLRLRQADLERENQQLIQELKTLTIQQGEGSPALKSLFFNFGRRTQGPEDISSETSLLRSVIDSVGDLIYVKDLEGVYQGCNKASETFVGLEEAEQIGQTDFDFFEHDQATAIRDVDREILATGQEHCSEEWVPSRSRGRVLLETKKAPFYGSDGRVAGIVGISRDITARKQAEDSLKKANKELDAFVRTVAHDLRAPLTPLIGYAELLQRQYHDILDTQGIEYLNEIISSGEEMHHLMKDLLALATAGEVKRAAELIDTEEVVNTVVKSLGAQLSSAGVKVKIGTLPFCRIPRTFLLQIFENLIHNAIKYGCKAGDMIEVGGERTEEYVGLYVRDQGPGIPETEREQIFECFYRGKMAKEKQGTGIGLATIHKIAEVLGGRTWVEETPGGGSTFWVEIHDPG